jgi:type IV pilus assembly protein PilQ
MKKHLFLCFLLAAPFCLWSQLVELSLDDIDLSDVVVIGAEPTEATEPKFTELAAVTQPPELEAPAAQPPDSETLNAVVTETVFEDPVSAPETGAVLVEVTEAGVPDEILPVVVEEAELATGGTLLAPATLELTPAAVDVDVWIAPDSAQEPAALVAEPTEPVGTEDTPQFVQPRIPVVETAMPADMEIVLEMPKRIVEEVVSIGAAEKTEEEETISVDFPDEQVRSILRTVADLYDLNIIIPETLQGRTSIKLKNVTWKQVFEVILDPLGFTYVEDRNIIRIKSTEELTAEPVDTRVFVVNYASAAGLQGSIMPLIDAAAGGRVVVDTRSNALVITERPSRMNKIQNIIDRLDKATDQVMIETKFIEVTDSDSKNIGVNWSSLKGYDVSAGPFNRNWTRERSSDNESTSNDGLDSSSDLSTTSGSINGNTGAIDQVVNNSEGIASAFDRLSSLVTTAATGRSDSAVFNATQFNVILSALKENNDSKLVANPTVVTMNNKEANIEIVTEIPQVDFIFNAETGQREASGLADPLKFGTQIKVTPQVNSAGYINLKVIPTVSNRIGEIETQVGPQPILSRRTAETNVVIKDGYTLAIGGLTQNEETSSGTKVPLLGDLPGLGRLFRSESTTITQTNLIIFITARTLNPDGSTYEEVVDPRVLEQMNITPSELPGYRIPAAEQEALRQLKQERVQADQMERIQQLESKLLAINVAKQEVADEAAQATAKQAEKTASKQAQQAAKELKSTESE